MFSGRLKRYDNVTAAKVVQIFQENEPSGTTNLAAVLEDALNSYFQRKASGKTKQNGETILVVTDGEPDDRKEVMKTIIEASRKLDRDEELAISFIEPHDTRETQVLQPKEVSERGNLFPLVFLVLPFSRNKCYNVRYDTESIQVPILSNL